MSPIERSAGGGGGGFTNPMTTAGDIIIENAVPAAARLALGASGQVLGVSGGLPAWVYPPGFEINYSQVTAPVNITSTTEATGTTMISPGAITFDGAPVLVQLFVVIRAPTVGGVVVFSLFEGATQITEMGAYGSGGTSSQILPNSGLYRFTPSVGSHTYTITAFASSLTGTPRINAGTGGTGGDPPNFVRFTKV